MSHCEHFWRYFLYVFRGDFDWIDSTLDFRLRFSGMQLFTEISMYGKSYSPQILFFSYYLLIFVCVQLNWLKWFWLHAMCVCKSAPSVHRLWNLLFIQNFLKFQYYWGWSMIYAYILIKNFSIDKNQWLTSRNIYMKWKLRILFLLITSYIECLIKQKQQLEENYLNKSVEIKTNGNLTSLHDDDAVDDDDNNINQKWDMFLWWIIFIRSFCTFNIQMIHIARHVYCYTVRYVLLNQLFQLLRGFFSSSHCFTVWRLFVHFDMIHLLKAIKFPEFKSFLFRNWIDFHILYFYFTVFYVENHF